MIHKPGSGVHPALWPVGGEPTPTPAPAMLAQTGTYTGTGAALDIDLDFVPDVVFVWATGQALTWRNNLSWHGRSQYFDTLSSSYNIRSSANSNQWMPFRHSGFGVRAGYSVSARTYNFLALRANSADTLEEISIVGNALAERAVAFTSRRSDLIIGKRDSARSAVFATETGPPARGDEADGPLVDGIAFSDTGMVVSDSVWVNENNNAGRGEAIEFLSFVEQDGFKVVRHVGTGGTTNITGLGDVVFLVDATSAATTGPKPLAVQNGQSAFCFDGTTPANAVTLTDGTLSLPSTFNALGIEYVVVSFADNTATENTVSTAVSADLVGHSSGAIQLSAGVTISGACSFEYYGRHLGYPDLGQYLPLLMLGNGTDGGTTGFNGGAYLYETDPDANGWEGGVLRIIHSQYLARLRASPHDTINYYNFNTGIVLPMREAVHLVVTHNGTGHWRVWLNGHLVKEYNLDIDQVTYGSRTNGGEGVSLPVYANGDASYGSRNELYRVQIWDSQLSDAEAAALFNNARTGAAWAGTAADHAWDLRDNLPGGLTGVTQEAPGTGLLNLYLERGGTAASAGLPTVSGSDTEVVTATGASNGRAYIRLGTGTFRVRSVIEYNDASRIICRTNTDRVGTTGTTVFDLTGTGTIDRTDDIVAADANLFYVGITTAGQSFIVKAATTVTQIA